jgi:D-lactate dehydrogenase
MVFTRLKLSTVTATLAKDYDAVSLFTSDDASAPVLEKLAAGGVRFIALRSVGYDHVDLDRAGSLSMRVANVPEYSPYSIAEHAVAMLMAVNRKIVESQLLMEIQDFRVDTLIGSDIHGKTVGIIGTGRIGIAFASIMKGFQTRILAYDPVVNPVAIELGVKYMSLDELLFQSDIVSIHCPLNAATRNMLAKDQFRMMKPGAILINTARGGLIKTIDLIGAIEEGKPKAVCLDVYENERGLFFEDHRGDVLKDPMFARLRSFKNVLITGHQAFLTNEAISGIAKITMANINAWNDDKHSPNELHSIEKELVID